MLSSSLVSTTQIDVVIGAVLCILGLGNVEVANRLLTWMGVKPPQISDTKEVSKDTGNDAVTRL